MTSKTGLAIVPILSGATVVVRDLVDGYRQEKMPRRSTTRRAYEMWFKNHILPRWAESELIELQPRPVELWLASLKLSPKSRAHVRGLVSTLWDYAMWRGEIEVQRNPIGLVTVRGATKRLRKPRSLTVEEFHLFAACLEEPFRTLAIVCVAFGLRISEALALRWHDVDWDKSQLTVERGIVCQIVDDVKTPSSESALHIDSGILAVIKAWNDRSPYREKSDWMFASPFQSGSLPYSYPGVQKKFQRAALQAEIGTLGTHTMRHTYRSWLDAVGTKIAVQQKLMRHADITTTMNIYGDVVTDEMKEATSKVARLITSDKKKVISDVSTVHPDRLESVS